MRRHRDDQAGAQELVELAALADGSLPEERRATLEEQVAASPELADLLAEQERAVALARAAGDEVVAPTTLRARLEAQAPPRRRARTTRIAAPGLLVGTAAAAAVIAAVVLGSGSSAERFQAALGPTGLVPGASGQATLTKTTSGWRIELDATGLPRRDDGL